MTGKITKVIAHPSGGYMVTQGGTAPQLATTNGETDLNKALAVWFMAGNKAESWVPGLDERKSSALAEARQIAHRVRRNIAGLTDTDRALGWVLKAVFGAVWRVNELAQNPHLAALSGIAEQGFEREAGLTGEAASDIRDRSVAKAGAFFLALQLVEGMERLAESQIPAAATSEDLDAAITNLRALETQALDQIASLNGGANS